MSPPGHKSWLLKSFVAHSSNVNCLALGKKSGRVMVTGGQDKKLNMWTIGQQDCIMSLSGHTSPIECVQFGNDEEMLISGTNSGNIKIWDLTESKALRKLTGHKAAIKCLDVHPYGKYLVSGSLDTNNKLWDIRKTLCAFSYKGHKGCINCVKFSPDGNWIASASDDGYVKLWDLKAGKLLKDLKVSSGAALNVEFHPKEFILVSTSTDRIIKFWDLETFKLISSTEIDVNPTSITLFDCGGKYIYAGSKDYCKIIGWEPTFIYDSIKVGWGKVADVAISNSQMIAGSFSQSVVSTYVVDLQKLDPFMIDASPTSDTNRTLTPVSVSVPQSTGKPRRSFTKPPIDEGNSNSAIEIAKQKSSHSSSPENDVSSGSDFEVLIKTKSEYKNMFVANNKLRRSPEPFESPNNFEDMSISDKKIANVMPILTKNQTNTSTPIVAPGVKKSAARNEIEPQPQSRPPSLPISQPSSRPSSRPTSSHSSSARPKSGQSSGDEKTTRQHPVKNNGDVNPKKDDLTCLEGLLKGHKAVNSILMNRIRRMESINDEMLNGDIKSALSKVISYQDLSIVIDFVSIINDMPDAWSLDVFKLISTQFLQFSSSKFEHYVMIGIQCMRLLLQNYGDMIKNSLNEAQNAARMVDVAREERTTKCKLIYKNLIGARTTLGLNLSDDNYNSITDSVKQLDLLMAHI